jgi:hypothetical protein
MGILHISIYIYFIADWIHPQVELPVFSAVKRPSNAFCSYIFMYIYSVISPKSQAISRIAETIKNLP